MRCVEHSYIHINNYWRTFPPNTNSTHICHPGVLVAQSAYLSFELSLATRGCVNILGPNVVNHMPMNFRRNIATHRRVILFIFCGTMQRCVFIKSFDHTGWFIFVFIVLTIITLLIYKIVSACWPNQMPLKNPRSIYTMIYPSQSVCALTYDGFM